MTEAIDQAAVARGPAARIPLRQGGQWLTHCKLLDRAYYAARITESAECPPMDRTIARLNIEHFQKLLAKETDETKRRTLQSLLVEEKAKLATAEGNPKEQKDTA